MDQIIRVKKLSTFGQIAASAEHTFRERPTRNADPALTPFNVTTGAKSSKEVQNAIKERLSTVTVKSDSVLCLEYLVTASPQFFREKTADEVAKYWAKTDAWMVSRHGKKNIVSSDLQLDESTPHKVYFVVPIVETIAHKVNKRVIASKKDLDDGFAKLGKDGKTPEKIVQIAKPASSKLSAKHFNGGPRKLSELQTDFYENVSKSCGLNRGVEGSKAKHETVKHWYGQLEPRIANAERVIETAEVVRQAKVKADKLMSDAQNWLLLAEEHIEKKEEKLKKQAGQNEKFRLFLNGVADGLRAVFNKLPDAVIYALPKPLHDQLVQFFGITPIAAPAALSVPTNTNPLLPVKNVATGLLSTLLMPEPKSKKGPKTLI